MEEEPTVNRRGMSATECPVATSDGILAGGAHRQLPATVYWQGHSRDDDSSSGAPPIIPL
jgi:hypothetical protein